jgi:ribosomal RNA-processing protein 8
MGCGEAELARDLHHQHEISSFDLVAANSFITVSDIANVPLPDECVDTAVFCLSLMGTNLDEFLAEAYRILKIRGELIIAEVESRLADPATFQGWVEGQGFQRAKNLPGSVDKMFILQRYIKQDGNGSKGSSKNTVKSHGIVLKPCLYKKR